MKIRVSDYIVEFLYNYGVKDFFMLSGGGVMGLTDGLVRNKNVNVVCFHHEQSTSMAIETYSRMTQNFGVGIFTTGPGATNAITGLAGAWLDSVPCLYLSGQVKRAHSICLANTPEIRQKGIQELNIVPIVESITKYTAFVDEPEDIKYHLEKAVYMAKAGRPGPSWLDIPIDVQEAIIDIDKLTNFTPAEDNLKILECDIKRIKEHLKISSRPCLLVGQGVRISKAIDTLLQFIEKYKIPVVTTYLGVDIIDSMHSQYVGRVGIKGDRAGNFAVQNSDLLIIIGSSLPIVETGFEPELFAREAKKIIVDINITQHLKQKIKVEQFILANAKDFLLKLLDIKDVSFDKDWMKKCNLWREKYPVCLPKYKEYEDKINKYYFFDELSKRLTSKDVVVTDAGSTFYVGSQAIKIKGNRYITSGGFATMGFSLPASIGVCYAIEKKRVMCVTGDGSFQQNIQELQVVVHHNLPIKIFILNNDGYLSIRTTQKKFCNSRYIGEGPDSGVSFPDVEKIAKAYGIKFVRLRNNIEFDRRLTDVINYDDGPVICEIMTPREQLIIPGAASEKKEDGTMVSKPLEDMFPFLDRKTFKEEMIVKTMDEE